MLTELQLATLRALVDRIIPADDFPSGWQAGVGDYLAGQFERDLRPQLDRYRAGLDALDAEAQASTGARFAELDAAAAGCAAAAGRGRRGDDDLADRPGRVLPDGGASTSMEGFYSDPGNGGNRDGVSWRMIGFEVRG